MKKNLFLLKFILLVLIIFWICKTVNLSESLKVLEKTNLYLFFLALILNNFSNLFLTIKWYRLVKPLNIKINFLELLSLNYISTFYSTIMPGQASGELIKGIKLLKKESSHENVWIPIIIDKTTNLLITFFIGFVAVLADNNFRNNISLVVTISLLTIFSILITTTLFSEKTNDIANFLKKYVINLLKALKLESNFIQDFSFSYLKIYKKNDLLFFETIFWSLLIKLPHVFAFYLLAHSLDINLNLIQSAWLFSIVFLASILPISFSGLGIREGTVLVLLSQIGIQSSVSLSLSIIIFTNGIITALIGGIVEFISVFKITKKNA